MRPVQEEVMGEAGREQLEAFRLAPWGKPETAPKQSPKRSNMVEKS